MTCGQYRFPITEIFFPDGNYFEKNFPVCGKIKKIPAESILSDISSNAITTSLEDMIPKQAFLSFTVLW